MKQISIQFTLLVLASLFLFSSCTTPQTEWKVTSPTQKVEAKLQVVDGKVSYSVFFDGKEIIGQSGMGFDLLDQAPLVAGFKVLRAEEVSENATWEMPWGEKREVKDNFNQLKVYLQEENAPNRKMNIIFKVYDSGLGFRYEFPEQEGMTEMLIAEENTQFQLKGDHTAYWIPGDWDIYEHLYSTTKVSEIDAKKYTGNKNLAQTSIPNNAVNTPVSMKTADGVYLSFHEANLTDYAGMTLKVDTEKLTLSSCLVGSNNEKFKVKRAVPFVTPWRTIQLANTAAGLIESDLIVNLNEPSKIEDMSWFTPTKYTGIWWDMHLGTRSWDYTSVEEMKDYSTAKPHGRHGATTEYAKELIDFSAANGIGAVLVEGWNTGWERWIGFEDREGVFDFVTPYPDYDLAEVVRYGKEKGVELIMHHETSGAPRTYAQQLDTAFRLMNSLGIHAVKTGYVGKIIPKGEFHHGQWMVNHYRKVLTTAAKYDIAINAHEPIKATGLRRTYPNAIAREGLRGQEFNAWASDGGNPPEHLPIVAFTRMLAGPIDYTPGIFNIKLTPHKDKNQVNTTLAQQLALYVVINSPVQMAADLIEYYKGHPAFEFIRQVPATWEQTKVLNAEIGDFVTIARQDRASENWFVGAITDENARDLKIKLDFLPEGKKYEAIIYADGKDAHWDKNPTDYAITKQEVSATSTLELVLAAGGGAAISLKEIK